MAQASSSSHVTKPSAEESSSPEYERKISSTSSRRRTHYASQRVSRSSRPTTAGIQATSNPKGKHVDYQEPLAYGNLDEEAVPPPIANRDDKTTYQRQATLEDAYGNPHPRPETSKATEKSVWHEPTRKRRRTQDEQKDLTEIAAPPPVHRSLDEATTSAVERQDFLEDAERRDDGSKRSSLPFRRRSPREYLRNNQQQQSEVPKYLTELYTISYLVFFAILGTLARLGTQWITYYPGAPVVTPVIWANFAGSLIMGFLSEDQNLFRNHSPKGALNGTTNDKQQLRSNTGEDLGDLTKAEASKRKKTIPLYIGLATGFCGSYTSFSSFARDYFLALSNNLPTPVDHPHPGLSIPWTGTTVGRNGGYSFEAFLHVVLTTLALSLGGLIAGAQIAIFLDPITPRIHGSFIQRVLDRVMVPLAFGCWLGAVLLAIWPPDEIWRGQVIFALVFAPLGCLLRFYASMKLNGLVPAFPLGTFAVNMLGTAVEGMCFDVQHVRVGVMGRVGGGIIGCQVLQGVLDGFCGCLTTVSTWVAEINGLKRKHGWAYAFGSVLGGLCLLVAIMGSVAWTVGYEKEACNSGFVSKVHG